MERLQRHIWLTAASYMIKYLLISSYIRKPFLIFKERGGDTVTQLLRNSSKDEFVKVFVRWQERCEKCIRIGCISVEKS